MRLLNVVVTACFVIVGFMSCSTSQNRSEAAYEKGVEEGRKQMEADMEMRLDRIREKIEEMEEIQKRMREIEQETKNQFELLKKLDELLREYGSSPDFSSSTSITCVPLPSGSVRL